MSNCSPGDAWSYSPVDFVSELEKMIEWMRPCYGDESKEYLCVVPASLSEYKDKLDVYKNMTVRVVEGVENFYIIEYPDSPFKIVKDQNGKQSVVKA